MVFICNLIYPLGSSCDTILPKIYIFHHCICLVLPYNYGFFYNLVPCHSRASQSDDFLTPCVIHVHCSYDDDDDDNDDDTNNINTINNYDDVMIMMNVDTLTARKY